MIEFITEEESEDVVTLAMVKLSQFFIDTEDRLCQKHGDLAYNVIADEDEEPYSAIVRVIKPCFRIKKILPHVDKIKFE